MKKRLILLLTVFAFAWGGFSIPKAKAMDPMTIAVLAPYAIPVAEVAGQYALKGLSGAAPGMVQAGVEMCRVLLLPLGVLECTAGMPFGFFGEGCRDIAKGTMAPFKMTYHILSLPFLAVGGM